MGNTHIYLYISRVVILVSLVKWMGNDHFDRFSSQYITIIKTHFPLNKQAYMPSPVSPECAAGEEAQGG